MSALRIIAPGHFSTVQDLGRPGFAHHAVPTSGALDSLSLRLANRLLGNRDSAAAIECTLQGLECVSECSLPIHVVIAALACEVAIARAASFDESALPFRVVTLQTGDRLRIGAITRGVRACLCVQGGFDVPILMNSRSTVPHASLGGHEGRPLRAGDRLPTGSGSPAPCATDRHEGEALQRFIRVNLDRSTIRVTTSSHTEALGKTALEQLLNQPFVISDHSNRVGIRLAGAPIDTPHRGTLTTEGMPLGGIQIPPAGEPIVLMNDQPTTGGYPLLACVIAADLPALAQRPPRSSVRFVLASHEEARAAIIEQRRCLDEMLPPIVHAPSTNTVTP